MNPIYAEQTLFTLRGMEIVVNRYKTTMHDLAATTSLHAGDKYSCATQECCDRYGGTWNDPGTSRYQCNDSGAGDWD